MNKGNQNNRLLSVDLARGLAVFFMISVHILLVFANDEVRNSVFGQIVEFLGGFPAAPVFMTLMGVSFIYSSKLTFKEKLFRGAKIFLLGYLLNVLRGVMPLMLAMQLEMDIVTKIPSEKINPLVMCTIVDILQLAGIALMIMAIIVEVKINKYIVLLLAFLISMISPFLWGFKLNIPVIDEIIELFCGDQPIKFSVIDNKIAFPVFPWLAFPLLGMFLGQSIKNATNQKKIFNYFGIFGILLLIAGSLISYSDIDYHFNDYYHSRQGGMLFMFGFVVFWIYFTNVVIEKVPTNSIFKLLFKWSYGVTVIYFVHWIIIMWSIALFGLNDSSFMEIISLILLVTWLSHSINKIIVDYQNAREKND